jgi:DNA polymerase III epsilon subunit-like protein
VTTAETARLVETLAGLLEGIAIDDVISAEELEGLRVWYAAHEGGLGPVLGAELRRHLDDAAGGEGLSAIAHAELMRFCQDFGARHTPTRPSTREAFARLQGVALGLLADGEVEETEVRALKRWLHDYEEFRDHFVFGSFFSTLDAVVGRGRIDKDELERVRELCETFGAPPPPFVFPPGVDPAPGLYELSAPPPDPAESWSPLPRGTTADFFTLDLETANDDPASVCAIGLAAVEGGEIVARGATLVDPKARFDPRHVRIHGFGPAQCRDRGAFATHWLAIREQLAGRWLLAHNATFAARCLDALVPAIAPPVAPPRLLCTLRLARRVWPRAAGHSLHRLARDHRLTEPRHDPQSGAVACAELALALCDARGWRSPDRVAAELGIKATKLSLG